MICKENSIRFNRLFNNETNRIFVVPMDHGVTLGPIKGIEQYIETIRSLIKGGADAIVLHKGILKRIIRHPELCTIRFIMHLSASTNFLDDYSEKILVATVEEALKLGADAVSIHVNLGYGNDLKMIKDIGIITKHAREWGMPLLGMMYANPKQKKNNSILHAIRIAEELGIDIVKIDYPGNLNKTRDIIKNVQIPVLIAGGECLNSSLDLINMIENSLDAGVSGIAMGRNIFQFSSPQFITKIVSDLVHKKKSAQEIRSILEQFLKRNSV